MKSLQNCLLFAFMLLLSPAVAQLPKLSSFSAAPATVFIDFDGQYVTGTSWNWGGDINAAPSGFSTTNITEIYNRVSEDFRPFDLNITTDSAAYWAAPKNRRMRIIVTPSWQWYGSAGGVSYVGSFIWGDNTPAWVFSSLLNNKTKWVAEAISHEIGHTLGLQHQSVYDAACNKTAEYSTGLGTGEIGWAPIMGAGYYQNHTTWNIGPNTVNCFTQQNDFEIIRTKNGFGLRPDDIGDDNSTASVINAAGGIVNVSGLINTSADADVFKLVLTNTTLLQLKAVPQNVGAGDDGANIDIKVTLLNGNDTINSYNPLTLLNAGVDTNLNAGTYFLVVDGVGNIYHDDAGSIGLYNLSGFVSTLLPVKAFNFSGAITNDKHRLSWLLQTEETVKRVVIETSEDAQHFTTLASLDAGITTYTNQPLGNETIYYRLRLITAQNERGQTSTIIALKSRNGAGGIKITGSSANTISVKSADNYMYQLFSTNGQLIAAGKLLAGINQVPAGNAKGLLLLHCSNGNQSFTQKLIQQ